MDIKLVSEIAWTVELAVVICAIVGLFFLLFYSIQQFHKSKNIQCYVKQLLSISRFHKHIFGWHTYAQIWQTQLNEINKQTKKKLLFTATKKWRIISWNIWYSYFVSSVECCIDHLVTDDSSKIPSGILTIRFKIPRLFVTHILETFFNLSFNDPFEWIFVSLLISWWNFHDNEFSSRSFSLHNYISWVLLM